MNRKALYSPDPFDTPTYATLHGLLLCMECLRGPQVVSTGRPSRQTGLKHHPRTWLNLGVPTLTPSLRSGL